MPPADLSPRGGVPLAPYSTLGIGGPARWFTEATTIGEVAAAHEWARTRGVGLFVLGGGSNLVIADEGIEALVLRINLTGVTMRAHGGDTLVTAGAGEPWDPVVNRVVEQQLAGMECLSGIPGSVGGTPVQNVGAYGQEVGDTIDHVVAFDTEQGTMVRLSNADCDFAYRMSRFKREDAGRFVVCEVTFRLRPGPATVKYPDLVRYFDEQRIAAPALGDVRAAVIAIRRRKGMVLDAADPDTRSVGSFFMNPVVDGTVHATLSKTHPHLPPGFTLPGGSVKMPAAWLIEQAGFPKGFVAGRVGLSSKHPLALVNRGGAAARDVVNFAARVKRQVMDRFGIALRPEPVFAGFGDDPDVQYLQQG
jgi:UDP-N-acetylmuramate dehydrogenase